MIKLVRLSFIARGDSYKPELVETITGIRFERKQTMSDTVSNKKRPILSTGSSSRYREVILNPSEDCWLSEAFLEKVRSLIPVVRQAGGEDMELWINVIIDEGDVAEVTFTPALQEHLAFIQLPLIFDFTWS